MGKKSRLLATNMNENERIAESKRKGEEARKAEIKRRAELATAIIFANKIKIDEWDD